jgi:hypothetical protein
MTKRTTGVGNGRRPNAKVRPRRDFKAEYARRVAKGLEAGKSRSQARGHARAGERPKPPGPRLAPGKGPFELAVRKIARGSSLRASAREFGLREETLRRYLKENVQAERKGRKWAITDNRPRQFPVFSEEAIVHPWLTPAEATRASEYMRAVSRFLFSGRRKILKPFEGAGVTDIKGRFYPFETDPDALHELDAAGELSFPELYKIVS